MDPEDALNLVNQWLQEKGQAMTEVQQDIFSCSWDNLKYSKMTDALHYEPKTISNQGSQ